MKGITVPCSSCKKILFRYLNAKGEVTFDMICPSCNEMVTVSVKLEPKVEVIKIVKKGLVLLAILGVMFHLFTLYAIHQQIVAIIEQF